MISRVLRDAIVVLAGEHTGVKRGPDGTELSDKLDVPSQFSYKTNLPKFSYRQSGSYSTSNRSR